MAQLFHWTFLACLPLSLFLMFGGRPLAGALVFPVSLTNDGEAWTLRVARGEPVSVGLEEVLRMLGRGLLRLEAMTVAPDLADYLFKHAVAQAEESLGKYLEALDQTFRDSARVVEPTASVGAATLAFTTR